MIAYFSGVASNGEPQEGHVEPKQGLFLSSNEQAISGYRPEQVQYICIRLAMFADGVRDIAKAAVWTWNAIEFAKQDAVSSNVIRFACWHAIPAALLSNDFVRAAQLVELMGATDATGLIDTVKATPEIKATADEILRVQYVVDSAPKGPKSVMSALPALPIVVRLASLQFQGRPSAAIVESLEAIESVIPKEAQPENFVAETRKALVEEADWKALWEEGGEGIKAHRYIQGLVLCIGAVSRAPVTQSLYLQISLAQNLEGFFKPCRSVYREIVAPFFVAYWERAIADSVGLFRTAHAYTQRQLQLADGSPEGTRKLLSAMRFCLGAEFPKPQMEWLDGSQ